MAITTIASAARSKVGQLFWMLVVETCSAGGVMSDQNSHLIHPTRLEKLRKYGSSTSRAAALLLLLAGMSATGCSTLGIIGQNLKYNDSFSDWVVGQRDSAWAAKAWHLRKHNFCNERYLKDFAEGFRAGYADVAAGSNGCTPALPPRKYWGWKYQSPEGQARVAAWFSGYPHGARAAEEDGIGGFSQIQVSSTAYNEYHQAGMIPQQTQMYPMAAPNPNATYAPAVIGSNAGVIPPVSGVEGVPGVGGNAIPGVAPGVGVVPQFNPTIPNP